MSAHVIDGKTLADTLKQDIRQQILLRKKQGLRAPGLAVILLGDDPASHVYVKRKHEACEAVGILSVNHQLPKNTTAQTLIALLEKLNADPTVDGILVQLPLPTSIDPELIIECIKPDKDIDGFHPYNLGRLAQRRPFLRPCTPYGVVKILESTHETLSGAHAVIIGASNIVGRPMALEMLMLGCTVTICHSLTHTEQLIQSVQEADILISAVGKPGLIQGEWIKPGSIVVDIGITRLKNGKITGDVDFKSAQTKAKWITPVPGGVGPMTVAVLLQNTLQAAELHALS